MLAEFHIYHLEVHREKSPVSMISQNIHPFVLSLFLSAMVVGSLALFTYRQSSPGSSLFALMSLFVALYAITYSFELLSSTLDWIWFWVKLEYVGIVSIPVIDLFSLIQQYTGLHAKIAVQPGGTPQAFDISKLCRLLGQNSIFSGDYPNRVIREYAPAIARSLG